MNECLFCKMVRKEIPAYVIYEDAAAIGVLDIHPIAPGHAFILPKKHSENILDTPDEELGALFTAVKRVTEKLEKTFHPDGFTIGVNHGKWAGQAIDHLHIHVIPRWKTDGGHSIHGVVSNPPSEALTEIKDKIIKE